MQKYKVSIDNDILEAQIDGRHTIKMNRTPRGQSVKTKSGVYILTDERGYCCYVGETNDLKTRMKQHESQHRFFWWKHTIYFWDDRSSGGAFDSTDERYWYEQQIKELTEITHPTFTKKIHIKPKPTSGDEVLCDMKELLDIIRFNVDVKPATPTSSETPSASTIRHGKSGKSAKPTGSCGRYSGMTTKQLRDECKKRHLPVSVRRVASTGKKHQYWMKDSELISQLESDDL